MRHCISVLGAGSWGTALALLIARNGVPTLLWSHRREHAEAMAAERRNAHYLPHATFPDTLSVTPDLAEAAATASDAVLVAVPSHAFRATLDLCAPHLQPEAGLMWATKGLDRTRGCLLHETAREILGPDRALAVLSGPTFAAEVVAELPSAITVGASSEAFGAKIVSWLHNAYFRAYTTDDLIGAQLGGACKNVLAIAAGISDGLGFGANARAALITRGLAEMMRLSLALGARTETLMGLAGVGDLVLTATDNQSRNRRFGLGVGKGRPREEIHAEIGQEIEGILAARLIHELAGRKGVDMPITAQTYRVLYEGLPPEEAVRNLLLRDPKPEWDR
ncbi:glycerol-3-phosphate dehydrogenase (NAD(P)+) [Methylococcus capsulatus str. Bath]|uniref:Glycerol-3-phosphate dehydrogenase [NAD(P)+] n=1 Tax=Methylococcus capsulatus (strain ATCC 33009 / NCIMB 11132 / Bath) TaxID=243233 RepID=GPDA_METCA|nr:NAD(P)H-dependent glycerol-3-phosphate dehydrogenase [Methylococcus capsulatus]Q604K1.1 RecName: Full=Glycerol-3-phosphate dehydrogenase [NAD(P)+]; AltName: Full=NAD(P)H-dependent glycerol-3-phosphate dehydrogenase [Methylococcus capsulatus str. Bath]AAU91408.1 glycerol-3-phosphate dehydrogenase (NAD(P)+) [Methylococcus capsulatus str. Bath]